MDDEELLVSEFQRKLGLLYFVRQGVTGPIKIGRTSNFTSRLRMLQTGCAAPLRVIATFEDAGWQEQIWHRAFAKQRMAGEWFEPTEALLDAIDHFRDHWDWPRSFEGDETEYLLDLIDIVGEFMASGDIEDGADLKRAFEHAEKDHQWFAEKGLYDERFPLLIQAAVIQEEIARLTTITNEG